MAGILAISASVTSPGTSDNNAVAGYVTGEQVVLSTVPTGSSYKWGQSIPSGSTSARSGLNATSGSSVTFTPDVAGEYVVVCTVDGSTVYTIRLSVTAATIQSVSGGTRYLPVTDASVSAPGTGVVLYFSSSTTPNKLSVKFPDNSIQRLTT
jgi:hypothetical protein